MDFIKRKLAKIFLAVIICVPVIQGSAYAQGPEDTLANQLGEYLRSDDVQAEILSALNVPTARRDIYRAHLDRIFSEPALLLEIARSTRSLTQNMQAEDFEEIGPIMAEVGFGVSQRAVQQGLRRLSPMDIRLLLAHEALMLEEISPKRCIGLMSDTLNAAETTEMVLAYQRNLSSEDLRQYLDLNARAMLAHFRDSPLPKTVSPSQREIAEIQFERALEQHPHFDLISKISLRPEAHSDAENCWAATEALWVAIEQDGIAGDWLMTVFAEDV